VRRKVSQRRLRLRRRETGDDEEPPAVGRDQLAAIDEEDALVRTPKRRLGGVEEWRRMLGHQDEGEALVPRRADYLFEPPRAVAAERGVNVEDARVLVERFVRRRGRAPRVERVNRRAQPPQPVTPVGERHLRQEKQREQRERDFLQALSHSSSKSTEATCSLMARPSWTTD
jgi:hypothetical protein